MPEIRLKIYRSPTESRAETYRQSRVTVGREINNDIVIPEKEVSRFHCLIECDNDGWRLTDLESTNGTFLNGICIKKALLKSGDVVVVGSARLHVLECPARVPQEPVSMGDYRVVQTFDARGFIGVAGQAPSPKPSSTKTPRPGEATPVPRFPTALAPVLTADEILKSAGDPRALARMIAVRMASLVEADACLVYSCAPESSGTERIAIEPPASDVSVPEEILRHVRRTTVAVYVEVEESSAVPAGRPRAVMCAAVLDGQRMLGMIALVRKEKPWNFGDPDLETLSVAAISAGAALGCGRSYARLERAYLDLLDASGSLPVSIGESQQQETDAVVLDSTVQDLRASLARVLEMSASALAESAENESCRRLVAEMAEAAKQSGEIAERLASMIREGRGPRGETRPVPLLTGLLPVLRRMAGPTTAFNDRIANELPAVAVAPRLVRSALLQITQFLRDRMRAVNLTLTADLYDLERPLRVEGFGEIGIGHYVRISMEGLGDSACSRELDVLRTDAAEKPRDPQSPVRGLYWVARMLDGAGARLIARAPSSRTIAFEILLPVRS
jgi:hypothetical protein